MFWDRYRSWKEAEQAWEEGKKEAAKLQPIKGLKVLPSMPGITKETAKRLKWKSLLYMISHDQEGKIRKHFLKDPIRYGWRYLKSVLKRRSFTKDGDFYFYGLSSTKDFEKKFKQKNTLLVVGFSYCQKPFECPSGRFTDQCIRDPANPICRQCPIGKVVHTLPKEKSKILMIPTVHYIGEKIFETIHAHPKKEIIFLITACEMTLHMFGDFGNMAGVKGIGVRLDGRICNTMQAFDLSERGIKPGLTLFTPQTEEKVLELISHLRGDPSV